MRFLLALLPFVLAASPATPVYVTASLTDRNNLFIENLTKDEVKVLEGGRARELELMARDELPVVYGLLFEDSVVADPYETRGRSAPATGSARNLAFGLIDKYLGRQAIWVGRFGAELQVVLEPTTDGFRAKDAIHRITPDRRPEDPFLYAALVSAVHKMRERHEKRRVLVLCVGSVDAETGGKIKPIKNLLSASNVELFAISFATRLGGRGLQFSLTQSILRELAQATAGEAFFAADYREHLDDVTRRIHNQLRTFYTFGFMSESAPDHPARLQIECSRQGSKVRHHATVAPAP